jgi:sugar phosphate isomerase/epimerase
MAATATAPCAADRVALFSSALPGRGAEQILAAASAGGFALVEWGAGPAQAIPDLRAAAAVRARCDDAGLASCGLCVQDHEATLATPERAAAYLELAVALGAPQIRYFAQRFDGAPLADEQERARAGLRRLVELAAPTGIRVLIETSPQTIAPSPCLVLALAEGHDTAHVGALYDPGNMITEGHLAPRLALDRLGPYLGHVHVKNHVWRRRDGRWSIRYAALERGILDWREILAALDGISYAGALAIDHLPGAATARKLIAESTALRALASR